MGFGARRCIGTSRGKANPRVAGLSVESVEALARESTVVRSTENGEKLP